MDKLQNASFAPETDNPYLFVNYVDLEPFWEKVRDFFGFGIDYSSVGSVIKFLFVIFAIFFLTLIAYCAVRLLEIRKKEHEHLHHEIEEYAHKHKEKEAKKKEEVSHNPRWLQVLDYIYSVNEGDWKLAVIEADSILEDLLDQLGFRGENLGEKLKSADQDSFQHLTRAWEVHTVRNRIAHEGAGFPLSHQEAKRVVAIYEDIFRQYGFI